MVYYVGCLSIVFQDFLIYHGVLFFQYGRLKSFLFRNFLSFFILQFLLYSHSISLLLAFFSHIASYFIYECIFHVFHEFMSAWEIGFWETSISWMI